MNKPSSNEEEYFLREDAERLRRLAEARRQATEARERERLKELHYMRCPKCGMQLEEVSFRGVKVDRCFDCGGMWLDDGEWELMGAREPNFVQSLLGIFRGPSGGHSAPGGAR